MGVHVNVIKNVTKDHRAVQIYIIQTVSVSSKCPPQAPINVTTIIDLAGIIMYVATRVFPLL